MFGTPLAAMRAPQAELSTALLAKMRGAAHAVTSTAQPVLPPLPLIEQRGFANPGTR
jgi:hypothetical protein